ncbi:MAG: DUF4340 domain-containing protein [Spirochaetia bacterium]|nr:DUF4340 domain-containing protein [Spirochaetia bacterium]
MSRKTGLILGGTVSLIFLGLLVIGPGTEKTQPDQIIWKKEFEKIEYIPAGKDRKVTISLVRQNSLTRDDFTVEFPGQYQSRRGGYNVKNTFTDFAKPRNMGQYKIKPEQETELGFSPECAEVLLYPSKNSKPIRMQIGKKNSAGNSFVRLDAESKKDEVVLIPAYLFDRFTKPIKDFREQRLLVYPTDSYTQELNVKVKTATGEKSYFMRQVREKNKDGIEMPRWLDSNGQEIPLNQANGLENAVRELQILEYRDTIGVANADDVWNKAAEDSAVIKIKIKGQDETTIHLRSRYAVQVGKEAAIAVQSSIEPGTDFVRATIEKDITDRMGTIFEAMERKKAEANKPKPTVPEIREKTDK